MKTINRELVYDAEVEMEYKKWVDKIPFLEFPENCTVQIIPLFRNAVVRFRVKRGDKCISVYLDGYDMLGVVGEPYWELYPNLVGDTDRFLMHETELLMKRLDWYLG